MPVGVITNPKGRGKGTPNKATKSAREAIAAFVDGNAHRLAGWLDEVARENPLAAFDRFMSVVEYHIPKLARNEHTGADGKDLFPSLSDEQMIERIRNLIIAGRNGKPDVSGNGKPALGKPDEGATNGAFIVVDGKPETQAVELQALSETEAISQPGQDAPREAV